MQPVHALVLLEEPTVISERICVSWSCLGMLRTLENAFGKRIACVLDGTPRVMKTRGRVLYGPQRGTKTRGRAVQSRYTIVTLGIVVRRPEGCTTALRRHEGRVQLRGATTHMIPVAQCLMDVESAVNTSQFLEAVCRTTSALYNYSLKSLVCQLHKDYAPGFEKARRDVFLAARLVNDFAHLMRSSRSTLSKHSDRLALVQEVTSLLQQTRHLPTLQLFDAIWSVFFSKLHREGHTRVLRYLQADVFQNVPLGNMSKVFRIAQSA